MEKCLCYVIKTDTFLAAQTVVSTHISLSLASLLGIRGHLSISSTPLVTGVMVIDFQAKFRISFSRKEIVIDWY